MMSKSYVRENTLALTFAIHHAQDSKILDDILTHTVCSFDKFEPAKLDRQETRVFNELLDAIPNQILSERSIEEERAAERDKLDSKELEQDDDSVASDTNDTNDSSDGIYVSQKNIEILSQILKNKAGILEKSKIEEIVQIICDAGLRLISVFLCNEEELKDLTQFVEEKYDGLVGFKKTDDYEKNRQGLSKALRFTIFLLTINNIEKIVSALSKPELREIMQHIRDKNDTPAFDVIYYFYSLDVANSFDDHQKNELRRLVEKYEGKEMQFLQRILSLRTQHYLNTHKVRAPIKQAVSSLLKIEGRTEKMLN
ncbi:hypothetical protein NTGBS_820007 [Candidatus Nitrotoga sp. BS]|uniref:hypothetical protein n=1 Tax=Candidatus Nitrotoga sp. BS TaxID=2890408 RepID=UPI001EF34ABA|nr:hypothetical protein [Candidatus Nitrotoga sp. BS]CAH1210062.1 hypothetical protein NTGBS_820007 [Candidatus Nitrotoga sp. BS]